GGAGAVPLAGSDRLESTFIPRDHGARALGHCDHGWLRSASASYCPATAGPGRFAHFTRAVKLVLSDRILNSEPGTPMSQSGNLEIQQFFKRSFGYTPPF